MHGKAIIFNGVGSVGKTSTIRELQKIVCEPFLHISGDAFLEMIPPWWWGHRDGITFEQSPEARSGGVEISMGAGFERFMRGMRASVAALVKTGNLCLVDDVMFFASDQQDYLSHLDSANITFVGLHASLKVLEQRERDRGDRLIGLARWQFERVHQGSIMTKNTRPRVYCLRCWHSKLLRSSNSNLETFDRVAIAPEEPVQVSLSAKAESRPKQS